MATSTVAPPFKGGVSVTGSCDECGKPTDKPRTRAPIKAGPLKGLRGMICWRCIAERKK